MIEVQLDHITEEIVTQSPFASNVIIDTHLKVRSFREERSGASPIFTALRSQVTGTSDFTAISHQEAVFVLTVDHPAHIKIGSLEFGRCRFPI